MLKFLFRPGNSEINQGVKNSTLVTRFHAIREMIFTYNAKYDFMWNKIKPMWSQNEPNTGKLDKLKS